MKILTATLSVLAASVLVTTFTAHGQAISYRDQAKLHAIAAAPNPENLRRDVQQLVDFGTRHTLSDTTSDTYGIGASRRWIYEEFQRISAACGGCLEVYYSSDVIANTPRIPDATEVVSVVAIQRGKTDPGRYVLMSGDIDSRVTDIMDAVSESPGANDNASGLAGTLEAARILSQYEFHGSIVYAALSGEEQGLFGGEILAKQALEEGWRLHAVLNNDMIGNIAGINGVINNTTARVFAEGTRMNETAEDARRRRFTGGEVDSPSRNLVNEFTLENVVIDNYFFGVAAVSKDGFESPVVFPGAAGTFDLR